MSLDQNKQLKIYIHNPSYKKMGIGPLTTDSGAWKPDYCQCFKQAHDFELK